MNRKTQQSAATKRILARRTIVDGVEKGLCLIEICGDNITVAPYTHETAATTYYNGTARITTVDEKPTLQFVH